MKRADSFFFLLSFFLLYGQFVNTCLHFIIFILTPLGRFVDVFRGEGCGKYWNCFIFSLVGLSGGVRRFEFCFLSSLVGLSGGVRRFEFCFVSSLVGLSGGVRMFEFCFVSSLVGLSGGVRRI